MDLPQMAAAEPEAAPEEPEPEAAADAEDAAPPKHERDAPNTADVPEVAELLQRLLEALLHERPDRPLRYMRDYVQRERDGVPHPPRREPTPEPEPVPVRVRRASEAAVPPLRSYYDELMRAKWFAEPAGSNRAAIGGTSDGLRPNIQPVRVLTRLQPFPSATKFLPKLTQCASANPGVRLHFASSAPAWPGQPII